eukprot:TRINITY_DN22617_c0_g1_i1.p1 TRINITY_DN22617_c0_g1~~TRINITY_DN22617_c0_g1_i1.p1  ORF type:complete len:473 (-),score=97.32 TRINITY_DN22617_c0_g1_i1:37-1455(-)
MKRNTEARYSEECDSDDSDDPVDGEDDYYNSESLTSLTTLQIIEPILRNGKRDQHITPLPERPRELVVGLKDLHWDLITMLVYYLDLVDVVGLNRTCKVLYHKTSKYFNNVLSLVSSFNENKVALSVLIESYQIEENVPVVSNAKGAKFLLYQKIVIGDVQVSKTLFKVDLPGNEILFVAQALILDCNIFVGHSICIQYKGKRESICYDEFGWDKPPRKFLTKYCGLLGLSSTKYVSKFFVAFGRLHSNLEGGHLSSFGGIDVDFDMFFEFGEKESIYFKFLNDLKTTVYYDHIQSQLLKVLPQLLRVSHYTQGKPNFKQMNHHYHFPEPGAIFKLRENLSLVDVVVKEEQRNLQLETKFLIYFKKIQQPATLHICFKASDKVEVYTTLNIHCPPPKNYFPCEDLILYLTTQLELKHLLPEEWNDVFLALVKSVMDTIGVIPPSQKNQQEYHFLSKLYCNSSNFFKSFLLKK